MNTTEFISVDPHMRGEIGQTRISCENSIFIETQAKTKQNKNSPDKVSYPPIKGMQANKR